MKNLLLLLFIIIVFLMGNMYISEHLSEKAPYRLAVNYIPFSRANTGPWNQLPNSRFSKKEVKNWDKNYENVM